MKWTAIGYALVALMVVDAVLSVYAAMRAPYPGAVPLGSPMAYRNIYLHVPIAWATYVLFIIGFVLAIAYLATQKKVFDKYSALFIYAGIVYAFMVLATGSAWAAESWGSFWNWDPRETGVLILFIAYLVYVAIRKSIQDPERRATVSAVYAIAAFATVPISFIMPYVAGGSLHPTLEATRGFISQPSVRSIFFTKVVTTIAIAVLIPIVAGLGLKKELTIGAAISAAILLIGAVMVFPWGATGRVVRVELVPGNAELIAYTAEGKLKIDGYLKATIARPEGNITVVIEDLRGTPTPQFIDVPGFARGSNLTVKYEGKELWPTLLGHIVKVNNNRVETLNPFCIAWTLFIYAVGIVTLAYILPRAS